ncbi:hypothetical protein [Echinicola sp. 20G]|uniref:hypothetical protein n=1 Tax=Echinicola sp. 20G TaxID=2781961 RepID=UPI0019105857|nr:hypothetical protein [Echinicola sp. 20G]
MEYFKLVYRDSETQVYEFNPRAKISEVNNFILSQYNKVDVFEFNNIDFPRGWFYKRDFSNKTVYFNFCFISRREHFNGKGGRFYFDSLHTTSEDILNVDLSLSGNLEVLSIDALFSLEKKDGSFPNISLHFKKFQSSQLQLGNLSKVELTIEDSIIENFFFSDTIPNYLSEILIRRCEFNKLDFLKVRADNIKIEESTVDYLFFENVVLKSKSKIEISNPKEIVIFDVQFDTIEIDIEDFVYKRGEVEMINIQGVDSKMLSIYNMDISKRKCEINKVIIENSANVTIGNFSIKNILLSNYILGSNYIVNSVLENVRFDRFTCQGLISFKNISVEKNGSILEIDKSILQNVELSPSFLHLFSNINFSESSLIGLKVYNLIDIPTRAISSQGKEAGTNYLSLYRELKGISQDHKNHYLEQRFKALEYNELLNDQSQGLGMMNKFILWANKLSNNHGTKPQYALGWMLFFSVQYITLLYFYFQWYRDDSFWDFMNGNYSYFIKPFLFLDNIKDYKFCNWLKVWDFGYKLLMAYLLYQFIAAFRKFNR